MNRRSRRELKAELEFYRMFSWIVLGLLLVIFTSVYGGAIGNVVLGMVAGWAARRMLKWWHHIRTEENELTGFFVSYVIGVAFWQVGEYFWDAGWWVLGGLAILIGIEIYVQRRKNMPKSVKD